LHLTFCNQFGGTNIPHGGQVLGYLNAQGTGGATSLSDPGNGHVDSFPLKKIFRIRVVKLQVRVDS